MTFWRRLKKYFLVRYIPMIFKKAKKLKNEGPFIKHENYSHSPYFIHSLIRWFTQSRVHSFWMLFTHSLLQSFHIKIYLMLAYFKSAVNVYDVLLQKSMFTVHSNWASPICSACVAVSSTDCKLYKRKWLQKVRRWTMEVKHAFCTNLESNFFPSGNMPM